MSETKGAVMIGGGGHARVLLDICRIVGKNIYAISAKESPHHLPEFRHIQITRDDVLAKEYPPNKFSLINAVGSSKTTCIRRRIFDQFKRQGYFFESIIHPDAVIGGHVALGEGIQIMAGSIIQPGVEIGRNCIINTGSRLDHDCIIGEHTHIAPGTILSGDVNIGRGSHIGVGVTVVNGITIGRNSFICAGETVTKDVPENCKFKNGQYTRKNRDERC